MSEKGHLHGEQFVELLKNGKLKKENRPNHGDEFTGGVEELHRMRFCNYISSCTAILIDERLKKTSSGGYCG